MLDHFVAPILARHDEGGEVAAAEAQRTERHHYEDRQQKIIHRTSSGRLAILAAILRASLRVNSLVAGVSHDNGSRNPLAALPLRPLDPRPLCLHWPRLRQRRIGFDAHRAQTVQVQGLVYRWRAI